MKKCPSCNQSFSDELFFCLNDGTVLETSDSSFSGDTPTIIAPSVFPKKPENKATNKSIYLIIGAMAIIILGLAATIFVLMSDKKSEPEISNATQNQNVEKPKNQTVEKPQSPTVEKKVITKESAENLINRWEKSQDERNFKLYRDCYAPTFVGTKRTKSGSETRMNFSQWISDRQKMAKNIVDVRIENLQITIDGDTANAQFIQHWKSVNYQDTGQKTMRIKMFDDGAKIVYEDLKLSD